MTVNSPESAKQGSPGRRTGPIGALSSSGSSIQVCEICEPDALQALIEPWGQLLQRIPQATVYQSPGWHLAWWQAFGAPHELHVITCYVGNVLVGLAPMMILNNDRGKQQEACFIGTSNRASDYADFLVDPQTPHVIDVLFDALLDRFRDVPRIRLNHMPSDLPSVHRLREILPTKVRYMAEIPGMKAPTRLLVDRSKDSRTANKRSLRRSYNYFNRSGKLEFRRLATPQAAKQQLDDFFEQHVGRRAVTPWPSQFTRQSDRHFFRELVNQLHPRGYLHFDQVVFDGRVIANHVGFEFRGRFYWYKPSFDIRLAPRSPGKVLLKFLLEDAINRGLGEFDFTVGEEAFKYRFANFERCNTCFMIFRSLLDFRRWQLLYAATSRARRLRQIWNPPPTLQSALPAEMTRD